MSLLGKEWYAEYINYKDGYNAGYSAAMKEIMERKTGKWLYDIPSGDAIEAMFVLPRCSICGTETPHPKAKYCPNCGANMEVDE